MIYIYIYISYPLHYLSELADQLACEFLKGKGDDTCRKK